MQLPAHGQSCCYNVVKITCFTCVHWLTVQWSPLHCSTVWLEVDWFGDFCRDHVCELPRRLGAVLVATGEDRSLQWYSCRLMPRSGPGPTTIVQMLQGTQCPGQFQMHHNERVWTACPPMIQVHTSVTNLAMAASGKPSNPARQVEQTSFYSRPSRANKQKPQSTTFH